VPSHLRFVVGELLSNASKATLRHVSSQSGSGRTVDLESVPIRVIVAVSGGSCLISPDDDLIWDRLASILR
jgi:hypothetical protein